VWQPSRAGAWVLFLVVLGIIAAWPPQDERSLAVKIVNWAVDPADALPTLPPQLGPGVGDDPHEVELRDAEVRRYDDFYDRGGWTRARLELKVATDPFNPSTVRQFLLVVGVVVGFLVWQFGGRFSGLEKKSERARPR